jgi:hypothetical protein
MSREEARALTLFELLGNEKAVKTRLTTQPQVDACLKD